MSTPTIRRTAPWPTNTPAPLYNNGHPISVTVVCLTDEPEQAIELQQAANHLPVYFFDGKTKPCPPIVDVYRYALTHIRADFFIFAHQDVRGPIPTWLANGLSTMNHGDVLGAIGFTPGKPNLWRNTQKTTPVEACDECLFGFFYKSGYHFSNDIKWTNYSHDIGFQARSAHHQVLIPPNSIGHAQHRYGPWFIKEGFYQKEHALTLHKYRAARWKEGEEKRYTPGK